MKKFSYVNATSVKEAVTALKKGQSKVVAGGTDIIGELKDAILPESCEALVNVKNIPGLDYIVEERGTLKIGATTRLKDIATNPLVKEKYTALAEAAYRTASPQIREMGTIAGNICQSVRCWYYWFPNNWFNCMRKGGQICPAIIGDNRYHSVFGAVRVVRPPCSENCPDHIRIPDYIAKVREGDMSGAAEILLSCNPMPSITGRVCPHFCQTECNRGEYDEVISIRAVERRIGDYALEHSAKFIKPPAKDNGKKVAVIGGGPAGLSAAFYLRKQGYAVTVYEKMKQPGGWLTYGIPPYRLPKDVVKKLIKAYEASGIKFKLGFEVGKDNTLTKLMESNDAVFAACGALKETDLGIKGEDLLDSGLHFLEQVNTGNKEAPGRKVGVIGGGNVAIDVARTLLRLGGKPIIVYRRTETEMPAIREEIDRAKEEKIRFEFLTQPIEVRRKNGRISLECVKMKLGKPDTSGRPRPVPIEGSEFIMEFDAVMKAIGERPDTSLVPKDFLDEKGGLKVNKETSLLGKNIFAGGDFVTGPATVVEAIAAGRKAAEAIDTFIQGTKAEKRAKSSEPARFNSLYIRKMAAAEPAELTVPERINSLEVEDVSSLPDKGVESEANRCFNCGCVAVNPSDIAPALVALNARIKTSRRVIPAEDFFAVGVERTTVLADNEIVTEIQVPKLNGKTKSKFIKFALRKSIDFPILNCAAVVDSNGGKVKEARICLNAAFNIPYRVTKAEEAITGMVVDEAIAESAADVILADINWLPKSRYKAQIAKALIKRAILACK